MKWKAILALIVCLALAAPVLAKSLADHDLSWYVIAGGGGRMDSVNHTLIGTAGQPLVGVMTGNDSTLCSGFWCGVSVEYRVYLPLVLRDF
jgi:hypothetical protein